MPLFMRGQKRPGLPREVYLRVMEAHSEEFSTAVDAAALPESVEDALSSLTEGGARVYLANAARQPLVLLHTVTVPAALRLPRAAPHPHGRRHLRRQRLLASRQRRRVYSQSGRILRRADQTSARFVELAFSAALNWKVNRYLFLSAGYTRGLAGPVVERSGAGKDIDFVELTARLQF
jgi:hypothetical protein